MNSAAILLFILGFAAWFWFDTQRSQEMAKAICQQVCGKSKLQFLDDTVVLTRLRLRRNSRGSLTVQRTYQFEFYEGGNQRQRGTVIMRGIALEMLEMPGYIDRTISPV